VKVSPWHLVGCRGAAEARARLDAHPDVSGVAPEAAPTVRPPTRTRIAPGTFRAADGGVDVGNADERVPIFESRYEQEHNVTNTIQRVGVVGCGLMGSGIAEVCARAGLDVVIREIDVAASESGRKRILGSLDRGLGSGKLTEAERDAAVARLAFTTDLSDLADRQLVVEAIAEDEGLKTEVFATLDRVVEDADAILASNTSSIPIMKLGISTQRPDHVVGIHFFNPVPVLRLVELVTSLMTSPETVTRAETFATDVLQKRVIRSTDRAGFVVNALLIPYLLSAIRMLESGFATAQDIDTGMVEGCSHPMGPLRLTDLIGLDTTLAVADSLYQEFKEPLYAPPPLLSRMVEAGLLGRKTNRGFYEYQPR
jgi:3-hydroxybutyryl-CoA dehydrogenase